MAKILEELGCSFLSFLVAGLLYFLACLLPCVDGGPVDPEYWNLEAGRNFGWQIVLFGWTGGNNGVPWSANVFLVLGLFCLWKRWLHAAAWLGLLASILGLTTWWVRRYDTLMIGYYFWQASLLVLAGGAALALSKSNAPCAAAKSR